MLLILEVEVELDLLNVRVRATEKPRGRARCLARNEGGQVGRNKRKRGDKVRCAWIRDPCLSAAACTRIVSHTAAACVVFVVLHVKHTCTLSCGACV